MRTWTSLAALLTALAVAPALAETVPPDQTLTLGEVQRLAVENHPRLQAQRFDAEAALQAIAAARSAYFPQVSAYADRVFAANNTRISANPGITDPTVIDHGSTGLGVNQMITDFGRTADLVDRARDLARAEQARTDEAAEQVLLDATQAYFDVLRAQALLHVAEKTLQDRETILKRVTAMKDARLRSDLDVGLAQQAVYQTNLLVLSASGDQDAAMATLSAALGYGSAGHFTLAGVDQEPEPPPDAETLVAEMLQGSPNLVAERAAREAAYRNADAADDAWLPTVAAQAYAGYSPIPNPSQHLPDTYAAGGVTVSVPIFTGGLLQANQAAARDEAEAADREVADTENRLSSEIRTAYASVRTAYDGIAVTDHLVETARQSLKLMQAGFEIGRNSIVDLSQAELQATEAEIGHADARYAYLSKLAALEFVVGRLSAPGAGK